MKKKYKIFCLILIPLILLSCENKKPIEPLKSNFFNPPDEAKIRAYWWWLNSMVTKDAISRDLEQMKQKGYGGAVIFDAGSSSYSTVVKTPAGPVFSSEEWQSLLAHTVKEADRLGLELSLSISSGWNLGGPDVLPSESQKKLVYSETELEGPFAYNDDIPVPEYKHFYKDITIQAFKSDIEASRIKNFDLKSLNGHFGLRGIYPLYLLREQADTENTDKAIPVGGIIDLSNKFKNGILTWDIPPGKWTVVRFGMSCKGVRTSTNSDGAGGWSLDHMSKSAFKAYFDKTVIPIIKTAQSAGNSLKYLYTDSWEMGSINWTQEFEKYFNEKRGYDPLPYLTVMTNRIVNSRDVSNRFLYDLRKTVSDAIYENHYVYFRELADRYGLKIHPESGGPHSAPIDAVKVMSNNHFPMGEFWARNNHHRIEDEARLYVKQSASVAHVYGKKIVAAEGPTTIGPHWERSPKDLKGVIDRVFCSGLNRIVWHTFTCSPQEFGKPGIEYFAGTHLNPNVTWWEQSSSFIRYINKCSYLLSRGKQAADILIYYGNDVPNFVFLHEELDSLPFGYDYDKCDAQAVLTRLSVRDKKILLPDGMEYRILVLPDEEGIDLEVLRKIEELVRNGITLLGKKPSKTTGLTGYPASDKEVRKIADRLWGTKDDKIIDRHYGKGRVLSGISLEQALELSDIEPDISFETEENTVILNYIHRKTGNEHIYFVTNPFAYRDHLNTEYLYRTDIPDYFQKSNASFRVSGFEPEIWDPLTGKMYRVDNYTDNNRRINFEITLEPEGSLFVIFKDNNNKSLRSYRESYNTTPKLKKDISRNWSLSFDDGFNTPESLEISDLRPLTEFDDKNIKYYSGHITYSKDIDINAEELDNYKRIELDLGLVFEIAEVFVNGKKVETVWKFPFKVDIFSFLKEGSNNIDIKVVNLWCNRLILDGRLPEKERLTQTNVIKFNSPDAEKYLRKSGLIGPVKLIFY